MTRSPRSWATPNRGTAYRIVSDSLEAQTVEAVKELRSHEVERLNMLQVGVWQKAMAIDVRSVVVVCQ